MQFDHLVLGANTLSEGQMYVQDSLGVLLPKGGQHQRFGTHNAVTRFAGGGYLEIIAIDPDAEPQQRPRWFSLDDIDALAQLKSEPKLLTWVVNTGSHPLTDVVKNLQLDESDDPSDPVSNRLPNQLTNTPMQRDSLHWNMLIPAQGRSSDLLFPWIIQWPEGRHPSHTMDDLGCELLSIIAWHKQPLNFQQSLQRIQCDQLVTVKNASENAGKVQLEARVSGPSSEVVFYGLQEKIAD